jgi:DNA polymerase-3 subunit delta
VPHPAASPAYLVRGDDPVLLAQSVRALVSGVVGDEDPTLVVENLAGDEVEPGAVLDACLTPPFLTDRRVVVVRNAGALGEPDVSRLVEYLDDPLPTTSLVLVAGKGPTSPRLAGAVRRVGEVVDAGRPSGGRARAAWLRERLRDGPLRLDAAAVDLLAEHLGEDVGRLEALVGTLVSAHGEGARLGVDEVAPLLGEPGAVAPWELTDAIDRGEYTAALTSLHRMMGAGERHPLAVMAILHRHFAAMLRVDGGGAVDEHEAAALLGMKSGYPARKVVAQSCRLGPKRIRRALSLLADADLDLRGASGWPDELVLEVLVARLCQLAPRRAASPGR